MIRKYHTAPLPFTGQKRRFVKGFRDHVLANIPQGWAVVDLFGGSGLLSHNTKYYRPDLDVYYNDYDGYLDRIARIKETEKLRIRLQNAIQETPKIAGQKIADTDMGRVRSVLKSAKWIDQDTVPRWLSFAVRKTVGFVYSANTFYYRIPKSPLISKGYLDGVHVTNCDFRDNLQRFSGRFDVFWIIDPPYAVAKDTEKTYKGSGFMSLNDARKLKNFAYFGSSKMQGLRDDEHRHIRAMNRVVNGRSSSYIDVMVAYLNGVQL